MKNGIIIRVFGGLGNQLFIYSFGRALSLKNECNLKFDIFSGFPKDEYKRKVQLHNFNITLNKASIFESLFYPIRNRSKILRRIIYSDCDYFKEADISSLSYFNKTIEKTTFFEGYWQSPKYFEGFEKVIRKDLEIIYNHSETNIEVLKNIVSHNSVAIHVRRVKYQPVLPIEFYQDSIRKICAKINDPYFFCFSDDIDWCKKNISLDQHVVFVDNNYNEEIEDFWLMTNCRHFIISNSTFAWWAAWLAKFGNKMVISPSEEYWVNKDLLIK